MIQIVSDWREMQNVNFRSNGVADLTAVVREGLENKSHVCVENGANEWQKMDDFKGVSLLWSGQNDEQGWFIDTERLKYKCYINQLEGCI